jgi:hypothetical protein
MTTSSPALLTAIITGVLSVHHCAAQSELHDALSDKVPLTFIGLDLSQARFVTRVEFPKLDQEGTVMFNRWNGLLQSEWTKYNLAQPLGLGNVPTEVQYVQVVNDAVDVQKAWASGDPVFDKAQIPAMVKKYNTQDVEGVGCVFIVGSFNKILEKADIHVTFFDMKTKAVLHTEQFTAKPVGFGERNYWAGAVSNVLDGIGKTYRTRWQDQFKKK